MRTIRLGDLIEYDGDVWKVYEELGDELVLRQPLTGRVRRVAAKTLLTDETFHQDVEAQGEILAGVAMLERLPARHREATLELHRHIYQLLNGTFPDQEDTTPQDPRYSTALNMADRVEAKAKELSKTPRQVWRHVRDYRESGIAGLVDGRSARAHPEHGRSDPDLVALAAEVVKGETFRSTGSKGRALLKIKMEAASRDLPVPSDRTLYRLINNLSARKHTFGESATRRSLSNQPDRPWGGQHTQVPGGIVEIDSTPLDVMVLLPNGESGRPEVTSAIDVATRTVLAAVIAPVDTKAVDAALVLARALTPPALQPGWAESLGWVRDSLPDGVLPSEEEYVKEWAARPHIYPESITMDRGKVFQSEVFMAACERLQISVINAASYTPTDKPHIERLFGTVATRFLQFLNGYTGRSVSTRGKDPGEERLWSIDQLQNLLDWWLVSDYQQSPHSELHHPSMPKRDLSPTQMYQTLVGTSPRPLLQLTHDDYLHMLPARWVTIQREGITIMKLRYVSKELYPLVGRKSGLVNRGGKWEIRYDPYRMAQIYLRNHLDGTWIKCSWMGRDDLPQFSEETRDAALAAVDNPRRVPADAVLKEILRIQTAIDVTAKERRSLARAHGTAHPAHHDPTDHSTPPDTDSDDDSLDETTELEPAEVRRLT